jgi:S-adenosylhomocysteine hydrolase
MFPDVYPFLGAMEKIADISMIIPKPKSKMKHIIEDLEQKGYPIRHVKRDSIMNITESIKPIGPTVLVDVGGYYPDAIPELKKNLKRNFCGVIEGTENGYKKYLAVSPDFPFYTTARSFLKEYEDRRVGRNIADATESVLTPLGVNLPELKNGTIGYGKIGRSYSEWMRRKGVDVVVSEINEDRLKMAEEAGFTITDTETLLAERDLICVANGDRSITADQFTKVKKGGYVVSVTSNDDAFGKSKSWLDNQEESGYIKVQHPKSKYVTLYNNQDTGHDFHLITDGNPVNLVLQMPVGESILLIQAEWLVAAHRLLTNQPQIVKYENDYETRKEILDVWTEIVGKKVLEEHEEDESTGKNEKRHDDRGGSGESESNIIFQVGL